MRGPVIRRPGGIFGTGPFLLPPHIPPLMGGAGPLPPPLAPLPGFRCHIPYHSPHPFPPPIPPQLALSLAPHPHHTMHRSVMIRTGKLMRKSFLPFHLPANLQTGEVKAISLNKRLVSEINGVRNVANKKLKVLESSKENEPTVNPIKLSNLNGASDTSPSSAIGAKPESIVVGNSSDSSGTKSSEGNEKEDSLETLAVPPEMTKPLLCLLCEAKFNSPLQASSHYQGKNHAKKVRFYLERLREKKGFKGPPPSNNNNKTEPSNKKHRLEEEYCKLCDVAFTSVIQANQHANGRNHQRRLRGENPLPKGFFNPSTGKWQRQPPAGLLSHFQKQRHKKFPSKKPACNLNSVHQLSFEVSSMNVIPVAEPNDVFG